MTLKTNLGKNRIVAFVTVVNVDKARTFYRDTLGLTLVHEDLPFALVFDANGIMLRVSITKKHVALPGTVLGWDVPEIRKAVDNLGAAGVRFERYSFLEQDQQGVWTSPTGARVAWFKDPDENLLSLTEFAG
jgi:catechol 2,3-dioxygenase-like lactoylglutathione lyase family enzyme